MIDKNKVIKFGFSFLLVLALLTFATYSNLTYVSPNIKTCINICESNNLTFYKINEGGFRNSICYCKDINGKIDTKIL